MTVGDVNNKDSAPVNAPPASSSASTTDAASAAAAAAVAAAANAAIGAASATLNFGNAAGAASAGTAPLSMASQILINAAMYALTSAQNKNEAFSVDLNKHPNCPSELQDVHVKVWPTGKINISHAPHNTPKDQMETLLEAQHALQKEHGFKHVSITSNL